MNKADYLEHFFYFSENSELELDQARAVFAFMKYVLIILQW